MLATLATVGLMVGMLIMWAPGANAAKPSITAPSSFEVEIPFPDMCSFPMTAIVRGRTLSITFLDASGTAIRGFAGGQLFVTYTRDDTGFSRTFAISGPTFFDATGAAVRGAGRWTTPMVDAGWVLANGNLTFDGTEDGFSLISTMSGNAVSLCDLMS
jgi:hypothetical protein